MKGAGAELCQQCPLKGGAFHRQKGCAKTLLVRTGQRVGGEGSATAPVPELGTHGWDSGAGEALGDAQRTQRTVAVGPDRDSRALAGHLLRQLVDLDLDTLLSQSHRGGQSSDSTADNGDAETSRGHARSFLVHWVIPVSG